MRAYTLLGVVGYTVDSRKPMGHYSELFNPVTPLMGRSSVELFLLLGSGRLREAISQCAGGDQEEQHILRLAAAQAEYQN